MKKQYLTLALALTLCQGLSAKSHFDASSQIYADHYLEFVREPGTVMAQLPDLPFSLEAASRGEATADVLVLLADGTTVSDLENYGLSVLRVIGDVAIANGTMDDIIALADTDLVRQVSFPKEKHMSLNLARAADATNADAVQTGETLSQPYCGKGVVTGIFDIGMDPNHVNFLEADMVTPRVTNLWVYSSRGRVTAYTTPDLVRAFTTDDRSQTHGTHTMGCLAGSYNGKGTFYSLNLMGRPSKQTDKPIPYYGLATEAEIIAATGDNTRSNINLACAQLADYIEASGKPGVISLSFGHNDGPHDLADLDTRTLNEIAKKVPFFVAAGNEGDENFTIVGDFTANNTTPYKTFLNPEQTNASGSIDIWSGGDKDVTVRLVIFDRTENKEVYSYTIPVEGKGKLATTNYSNSSYIKDPAMDLALRASTVDFANTFNEVNNRWQTNLKYSIALATSNSAKRYMLGIVIEGTPGLHFDLINNSNATITPVAQLDDMNVPGWIDGTPDMSISGLACGPDMLCIGAWNTRNSFPALDGKTYSYPATYNEGLIAPFSSYGTLYNGTTLPLACAPGTGIISSISSYYVAQNGIGNDNLSAVTTVNSKEYYYQAQNGTSMATPIAAGIAALWLQANPNLSPAEIKTIISSTCDPAPSNYRKVAWGAGKINALEGIKMAIQLGAGVSDVVVNPADIIVTSNGANSWQVIAPGASAVNTVVYDMNGRAVLTSSVSGDTAEVSGESLRPGIYILRINDSLTQRVAVK